MLKIFIMISVKSLCNSIKNIAQRTGRNAAATIPAIVMLCSLAKRPGLSTVVSVMRIVQKYKEFGINTDKNPDGSENLYVLMTTAIVDEVYRALREDANVQGATAPSAISFMGTGANAGGPITINGFNINPFKSVSVIQ